VLPNTATFKEGGSDPVVVGDNIIQGRDPFAGASNGMTFKVAGFSQSLDNVLCSWKALYAMYADVDGDSEKFETNVSKVTNMVYPCIARPAPGLKAPKDAPESLPSLQAYIEEHIAVGMLVLKSAADTGSLDLTARQITEEQLENGTPIDLLMNMEISEFRQAAIDGMKHTDSGVEEDTKDIMIATYGVNGKIRKLTDSPMTYRLLRKDAGIGWGGEVEIFMERIRLLNLCTVHPDHPYIDFFSELKGIHTTPVGSDILDSDWAFQKCYAMWKQVEVKLNAEDSKFHHNLREVVEFGAWMTEHYRKEAARLLKLTETEKKEGFGILREYLRREVAIKCQELFVRGFIRMDDVCGHIWSKDGKVIPFTAEEYERIAKNEGIQDKMTKFQRHLTIYLGTRGFGRGTEHKEDKDGNVMSTVYGKSGTVMWNMLEEHTTWLGEIINKECVATGEFPCMNPELEEIKASLIRNREKAKKKAEQKAQDFIDAETVD
jgi:hypothetical protein